MDRTEHIPLLTPFFMENSAPGWAHEDNMMTTRYARSRVRSPVDSLHRPAERIGEDVKMDAKRLTCPSESLVGTGRESANENDGKERRADR